MGPFLVRDYVAAPNIKGVPKWVPYLGNDPHTAFAGIWKSQEGFRELDGSGQTLNLKP